MNTNTNLKLLAILIGGLTFNFVFWGEELALNLVLFSTFTLVALLALDSGLVQNRKWLLAVLIHALTCVEVVYNNMPFSILAYYATFFVMLAFAHLSQVKTMMVAGGSAIFQLLAAPISIFQTLMNVKIAGVSLQPIFKIFKFWILPLLLLIIFSALYANANETFGGYFSTLSDALQKLGKFISEHLFVDFTLGRLIFFFIGIFFSAGILLKLKYNAIAEIDAQGKDELVRNRRNVRNKPFVKELIWTFTGSLLDKKLALKTENTIGVICFASLNVLLFLLNSTEISEIFTSTIKNFATELHEGTGILIFSIILALIVILFFFNGNLNFYSRNKNIKNLAIVWIAQNAILVLMVLHKDWAYVSALGLTEKRIGVFIFALICSIGLVSVFIKVKDKKSLYYLMKVNSFAWLAILVMSGFFHWEKLIFDFNFNNRHKVPLDYHHTTSLSNHVLISMYENRGMLAEALKDNRIAGIRANISIEPNLYVKQELQYRIDKFMVEHEKLSYLSWNYDDWRTYQYFKSRKRKIDAEACVK